MVLHRFREHLAASRSAGRAFDAAWAAARREVRPGREWAPVLEDTRDDWRAAFDGEPAPRRVVAIHAVAHDEDRETVEDARGICEHCGGLIPATRQRNAIYCSTAHQRAAHGRSIAA